ncbi:hypothetical protein DU002_14255 [Corallincola holothuriorum]|uniref:Methyl-accepting chemotaxis protein n=1 Tax=Corallincola holothuriorum TaxID=2282215 RepID=A0A368N7U5_9GAMM|nr:hypothetical protein [Corallincola holothuriorum]RCU45624.1 hypothetical protein DU002_14255 [Corallincola holothuriorum]
MMIFKRAFRLTHGISKLLMVFMPLVILACVAMAIFHIHQGVKHYSEIIKADSVLIGNAYYKIEDKIKQLSGAQELKRVEEQWALIYSRVKVEVEKDKRIIDDTFKAEWAKIKADAAKINSALDEVKRETDQLVRAANKVSSALFGLAGFLKPLLDAIANNALSVLVNSINQSFGEVALLSGEVAKMIEDGIQAIEVEQLEELTDRLLVLNASIKADLELLDLSLNDLRQLKDNLAEQNQQLLDDNGLPIGYQFVIYGLIAFFLSLFYFAYLYLRHWFLDPLIEAMQIIKLAFEPIPDP